MNDELGRFEEQVLLAIAHVREAYGVKIRQAIEQATGKPISIGAIYATLDRLEEKGFVRSWEGGATPVRGGRTKKYYAIEGAGEHALHEQELGRVRLRSLGLGGI